MATISKKRRNANKPLMWAGLALYAALLLLFGVQTWAFVNWLFPNDQLGAKVLTMVCFDVMALFWSLVHTFYNFKSVGAHWWVRIAWGLTFVLSFIASILYLVIQFFFRFHMAIDSNMVNAGYVVSIVALVFNILSLMAWLILEYNARNPHRHEYEEDEEDEATRTAVLSQMPQPTRSQIAQQTSAPTANYQEVLERLEVVTGELEAIKRTRPLVQTPAEKDKANGAH